MIFYNSFLVIFKMNCYYSDPLYCNYSYPNNEKITCNAKIKGHYTFYYSDIKYDTDGSGDVYPDIYDKFEKEPQSLDKKKKGKGGKGEIPGMEESGLKK